MSNFYKLTAYYSFLQIIPIYELLQSSLGESIIQLNLFLILCIIHTFQKFYS